MAVSEACKRKLCQFGESEDWQGVKPVYDEEVEVGETLPPGWERFWRTDDGLTAARRAEAYGIDLSLLEENLCLTPRERLRRNDRALHEAEALAKVYVEACKPLHLEGGDILHLTLDALIIAKRATGRPRDLHAVLELEAIREKLRGPR